MLPECAALLGELDDLLSEAKQIVRSMSPDTLNYVPVEGANSIYAMATHVAGSLRWWLGEILAGRNLGRDREAEFRASGANPDALITVLDDALALAREILGSITPEMLEQARQARTRSVTVRWIVPHVVAHTALHLGHMQLTAQLAEQARTKETG